MTALHKKLALLVLLIVLVCVASVVISYGNGLTLSAVRGVADALRWYVENKYVATVGIFIAVYIVLNLWFPAADVLTLLAGYLYGTALGTIYVMIAAVAGAMLSFWISRTFAGWWIQKKWARLLRFFNLELRKRGHIYLLMVRLIPMMPYVLVNFLAGLTRIKASTFLWTTALGSLPGIFVLCYAGRQFLSIKSVDEIFTPRVIAAFILLALFIGSALFVKSLLTKEQKQYERVLRNTHTEEA